MIVGEHAHSTGLAVEVTREERLTNLRPSTVRRATAGWASLLSANPFAADKHRPRRSDRRRRP
jgi:hypothetical protein